MTVPAQTYRVYPLSYALNCTKRYFSCIAEHFASPVLLQSDALANAADRRGRFDILTATPDFTVEVFGERVCLSGDVPATYRALAEAAPCDLNHTLFALQQQQQCAGADDLPFVGGFIGYLSYDYGRYLFGLLDDVPAPFSSIPQLQWRYHSWAIIVDHLQQRCQLVIQQSVSASTVNNLLELLNGADFVEPKPIAQLDFAPLQSRSQYLQAIARIKEYISAGDCYQVNYAQCFKAESAELAPQALYWQLQGVSPAPYSAFYAINAQTSILSFSPERFIALSSDGRLLTQPIKGTIARAKDAEHDALMAKQLCNDEKNRAENLMIVDLLRNDFGRIAAVGSVSVSRLFELQSFSNVHHLVSSIEAKLATGSTASALWQHCFPGGSITGAPKKRAMEIIDELELMPRSIYCGSIVYVSNCGNCDSNILIRSILQIDDHYYCWGGGGIVADSIAEDEYQETLTKINRLISF